MSYKFPERTIEKRSYELALILNPEDNKENLSIVKHIEKIIKSNKGKIVQKDSWGVKRMAYAINKFKDGDYTFLLIEIDQKTKKEIETFLKDSESILRFRFFKNLNYKSPIKEEKPKEEKPKEEKPKEEKPKEEKPASKKED